MRPHPDPTIRAVHNRIAEHGAKIARLFLKPVNVTILVRCPGIDEADVLVSSDTIEGIEAIVARSKSREEHTGARSFVSCECPAGHGNPCTLTEVECRAREAERRAARV